MALCFACNGLGQQGLTSTRRAYHQNTAWNAATQFLELGGVTQELNQFRDFFLGFITTCHIGKCSVIGVFIQLTRLALTERESAALAAALHLAHKEYPDTNQQQHGEPGDEYAHEDGGFLIWLGLNGDVVLQQVRYQPWVGRRIGIELAALIGHATQHAAINGDLGNAAILDVSDELRVHHLAFRAAFRPELVEHRHEHKCHDEPDSNILYDVIQGPVPYP